MPVSNEQKYDCAVREVKMRRKVYPRWIEIGKMSKEKATHEIECMEAIAEDYQLLASKDRLL